MWKPEFDDRLGEQTTAKQELLLEGFLAVPIHHRHAAALPVLRVEMKLKASLHAKHICSPDAVQQAVMEYISALEYIIPHPSDYLVQQACDVAVLVCASSAFSAKTEKNYCTKALRMFLLVLGRDIRESLLDELVLKSHQNLPVTFSTEVCAFCEEFSLYAALTLSRCGQCKAGELLQRWVPEGPLEGAQKDLQGCVKTVNHI